MRLLWLAPFIFILVSLALLVFVRPEQHKTLAQLTNESLRVKMEREELDIKFGNWNNLKAELEGLVEDGNELARELEARLAEQGLQLDKKRRENITCHKEKSDIEDELAVTETEHRKMKESLKAELDNLVQEKVMMGAKMTELSPVCNYVREANIARKLCGGRLFLINAGNTTAQENGKS